MKRKPIRLKAVRSVLSALLIAMTLPLSVTAHCSGSELKGDLNTDGDVNTSDLAIMGLYLKGNANLTQQGLINADLDSDGYIDSLDLILLRKKALQIVKNDPAYHIPVINRVANKTSYRFYPENDHYVPSLAPPATIYTSNNDTNDNQSSNIQTTTSSYADTTTITTSNQFINAPIDEMYGSFPTENVGKVCIFYVDFPDCRYEYEPSLYEIGKAAFSKEDTQDPNYPHESINAFYKRSSKNKLSISGNCYRYTTMYEKEAYENDIHKVNLVDEIIDQFDQYIDFNNFDGNGDGVVDSIIISVPEEAGKEQWWPCAGIYNNSYNREPDGLKLGHIIVGNAEIEDSTNCGHFVSSYVHELGHCMGLPDYYLYNDSDTEGLHGSAGFDTMDEVYADYSCISKLMTGWYKKDQVMVYNGAEEASYTLRNAQTNEGNCLIIPYGDLDSNYCSEYLILEYTSLDANNSDIPEKYWWQNFGSGIRVLHVNAATEETDHGRMFLYRSGNDPATNSNFSRRFVRVVNDTNCDNLFRSGSIISSDYPGFAFYDINGFERTDPGVEINVGNLENDSYTITIYRKAE